MNDQLAWSNQGSKKHLPLALVIDTSASTDDIRDTMNDNLRWMLDNMKRMPELRQLLELLVIHYNSTNRVVLDFEPLENIQNGAIDISQSTGCTHTGEALLKALDRLKEKEQICSNIGEYCGTPVLLLITDGNPDAGDNAPESEQRQVERAYEQAARRIKQLEQEERLFFCAVGIQLKHGYCANMEKIGELSMHRDRILCVDEDAKELHKVCEMICSLASAMACTTPMTDAIDAFFG